MSKAKKKQKKKNLHPVWWSKPLSAIGFCLVSTAVTLYIVPVTAVLAQSASSGCWADECIEPDWPQAIMWYLFLVVSIATPFFVLLSSWKAWFGWFMVSLLFFLLNLWFLGFFLGYI